MNTLLALADTFSEITLADSSGLVNSIRNFVGPIVLLVCGIAALTFLFQRQIMQMVIFLIIAVVVLAVFYAPDFIRSLGSSLGESQRDIKWG